MNTAQESEKRLVEVYEKHYGKIGTKPFAQFQTAWDSQETYWQQRYSELEKKVAYWEQRHQDALTTVKRYQKYVSLYSEASEQMAQIGSISFGEIDEMVKSESLPNTDKGAV